MLWRAAHLTLIPCVSAVRPTRTSVILSREGVSKVKNRPRARIKPSFSWLLSEVIVFKSLSEKIACVCGGDSCINACNADPADSWICVFRWLKEDNVKSE